MSIAKMTDLDEISALIAEPVGPPSNQYAERDIVAQGEHYMRHLSAMTGESLDSKSDIAAELAHRDIAIAGLIELVREAEGYDTLNIPFMLKERDELRARVAELEHLNSKGGKKNELLRYERDRLQAELDALRKPVDDAEIAEIERDMETGASGFQTMELWQYCSTLLRAHRQVSADNAKLRAELEHQYEQFWGKVQ